MAEKTFFFGDFELSGAKRTLFKGGEIVSLNSKTFDLLFALVENHGQILSKDEILDRVWEGQFVEENNLTVQISALRKILGETKCAHQFIATITGKGYKFVHEVRQNANNSLVKTAAPNISNSLETIIGREAEINEIRDFLRRGERLITFTGAGGSGKTALAKAVADEVRNDYAGDVFFVELAAINQAELVVGAIAQKLGIKEAGAKNLLESVKDFLCERSILLVLDNFEQIISASFLLAELIESAANLQILVTSRAVLHLNFEREKQVLPLDVPPDLKLSAEDLARFSSVELFAVRAQTARASFALNAENASVVAAICRKLDGLPLAVELAAARVRLLSPLAILVRLEKSLDLLTGGTKDLPMRQRTMRGAIQWSYELLDTAEQKLFRSLAVFVDGFTVEAAEFLEEREKRQHGEMAVDEENLPFSPSVLDILTNLIDNNLLVQIELPDENVRLRMLEVVREFAFEILQTTGELDDFKKKHAQFFLALVEKAEPLLHGETGNEWLERLETEHDNLRAALCWSLENDGQTAARIAAALRFFWLNRSHLSEGLSWSSAALQATENNISKARSDLLLSNGVFLRSQGNLEAARESYQKTLAESRQLNDLLQIIKANHGLAAIAVLQKDFDTAQTFIEESLALSRELNDETQIAYSLASLGDLEMSRENLSIARPLLEECLTISKKLSHKKLLTVTYFNLGTIDYFENSFESAAFNFAESLQIAEEMSNTTMISCALEGFAALAAVHGNAELSAKLAGAAENLRAEIGYQIEPAEEIFREKYLTTTRAALPAADFTNAYETGRGLNYNESIALTKIATLDFDGNSAEEFSEIIIETHQISHIVIEESD